MSSEQDQTPELSPLKRALFALKDLGAKLDAVEQARVEPIAIVGMACRFPGAPDIESYWRLLDEGRHAIREVPRDRWDVDEYYDPNPDAPGKTYAREGGFIEQVDKFDAPFFGIPPREVVSMDPQQRLLLEIAWEALENAGISPSSLAGTAAGVFVGLGTNDFTQLTLLEQDSAKIDAYIGTGGAACVAAGRISYILGLHGPAMALDTACSSSLVAIDIAVQQLRAQRCNLAMAGGVSIMLLPTPTVYLSKVRALSPSSRCKAFDASADGYVRGEGCGFVVLKRLSDAVRDGDTVLAVVRGAASNHDGRSSGLTVPNGQAQQAVIREALANAGLEPSRVNYVEAHGTGTPLGDPIEVRALGAVLGENRDPARPFLIGTVKTNIGHLEAAAGVAGLIKVVLAMRHGRIPASLHFTEPSPHIPWSELPVAVASVSTPWPVEPDELPIAGISAYGFSGTNAHVIVQAFVPPATTAPAAVADRSQHILTLAAQSPAALQEMAGRYAALCGSVSVPAAADLAFSANTGRSPFDYRLAVAGESAEQFAAALTAYGQDRRHAGLISGHAGAQRAKIAFLFTGQGSQYVGMSRELYETEPAFKRSLDRCEELLRPYLEQPLTSVLFAAPSTPSAALLDQTAYTQPALFAIECSLAELWRSWGIEPSFVMGHSVGEYAAACTAGLFNLEDGLRLIATRARLMQALPAGGRMAAVFAPEAAVRQAVAPHSHAVSIAAVNGPEHTVISGAGAAVEEILQELKASGIKAQPLVVSHAFHSPLMEPILDEFERAVAATTWEAPRLRIVSNLTGEVAQPSDLTSTAYWRRHLREPVRFSRSVETLAAQGVNWFLEIGPHPVLLGMAGRCVTSDALWLPSLRKGTSDWQQMLKTLGTIFVNGGSPDWRAFEGGRTRRRVALPTYPFQRARHWLEIAKRRETGVVASAPSTGHPLLGERIDSPLLRESVYQTTMSAASVAFVRDHVVFGTPVFPATGYVEMATAAARTGLGAGAASLEEISIEEPLAFEGDAARQVQIALAKPEDGGAAFQIFSRDPQAPVADGGWARHAFGRVRIDAGVAPGDSEALTAIRGRLVAPIDVADFYARLTERGVEYGPAFRAVKELWSGTDEALARLELPEIAGDPADWVIHPGYLDAALQILLAAFGIESGATGDVYLPVGLSGVRQYGTPGTRVWSYARIHKHEADRSETLTAELRWYDESGQLVWQASNVTLKRASVEALRRATDRQLADLLYEVEWQPAPASTAGVVDGTWLILADRQGTGEDLAARLRSAGGSCLIVRAGAELAIDGDAATVDPTSRDHLAAVLDDARRRSIPLQGVVHLWGLDAAAADLSATTLAPIEAHACGSLLALVQAMAGSSAAAGPRLWVGTRGAMSVGLAPWPVEVAQAPLWGLARTVALEQPGLRCTTVDLDPGEAENSGHHLAEVLAAAADETHIAVRGGASYVARLVRRGRARGARLPVPAGESFQLTTTSRGVLDNLTFESRPRVAPGPGEVEIRVHAAGLNFRDVLNALGMYPGDPGAMGGECAGRVTRVGAGVAGIAVGDDVLCLAGGSFSRYVVTPREAVVRLPANLTHEQAASIPVTFLTACYGLHHLAKIKKGDRVLVHAAAGGVGQAAVQLALRAGAEVYGTAGSVEKQEFVRSLGVRGVFSSRTAGFGPELMAMTGGRGVDIVLNSLTGAFIPESLRALAPGGHFLEIGKAEIWDAAAVSAVNPHVSYRPYDLAEVMLRDLGAIASMFDDVMAGVADGSLRPLPIRVFDIQDAIAAFRFMAQAKHVGKLVLSQRDLLASEQDGADLDGEATYWITGGCGGLGLKVAQWLVSRGGRHLTLSGRSLPDAAATAVIEQLRSAGASVAVAQGDISDEQHVRTVVAEIAASGHPLRGVVHAAGVLDDGVLTDQTWSRFERVMAPKVRGSWLLHDLTRDCRLDFFVLFSSTSATLGAPGQGNYAAANAFLDALAYHRRAHGLSALSINWSGWGEIGMAARLQSRDRSRMTDRGVAELQPEKGVRALGLLLNQTAANVMVAPIRWSVLLKAFPAGGEPPLLRALAAEAGPRSATRTEAQATGGELKSRLAAVPEAEREGVLLMFVQDQVARVLGLATGQGLDPQVPFTSLGIDSLMAVELRNALASAMARSLPPSLTFDYPTIATLAAFMSSEQLAAPVPPMSSPVSGPVDVGEMTEEQVDSLLTSLLAEPQGDR